MLKVGICDDEMYFTDKIQKELEYEFARYNIQAEISVYHESDILIKELQYHQYGLLFLDIEMPNKSGFEIAEEMQFLQDDCSLVFVTNQTHLVFRSFTYEPFGFVRKELMGEEIGDIIERFVYKNRLKQKETMLTVSYGHQEILVRDIIYMESKKHTLFTHRKQDILESRDTIGGKEEELAQYGFIRIHHGFLANTVYISRIISAECHLTTGQILPVSRSKKIQAIEELRRFRRKGNPYV